MSEDEKSTKMENASECLEQQKDICFLDVDGDGVPDYVTIRIGYIITTIVSIAGICMTYVMY